VAAEIEAGPEISPVDDLLARAARADDSVEAARLFFNAARLLWDEGDAAGAEEVLGFIDTEALDPIRMEGILLLRAEVAATKGDQALVLSMLNEENFPTLERLSDQQRIRFVDLRATALADQGEVRLAVTERVQLERLLSPDQRGANHESLWQALKTLSATELETFAANSTNDVERGWYQLALVTLTWSADLDRQLVELRRWRNDWSEHPAALLPPREIELSEIVAQERPTQVALLLPLGDAAGLIVRDAFMSGYFNLLELGGQVPDIRFYDTDETTDIIALHRQARAEGAQMIIGPLVKQQVAQLQQESDLGVPTLALNNNEGQPTASPLLYQFALSPESEARQVANKAWRDGHRNAAILSPLDEAPSTFTRKRDSFVAEWERLGGRIVAQDGYHENYTDAISGMLQLDASNARAARVRELIGRPIVSVQRRRQDIDFIYLLAQPGPARQIVPSLAYLYAGDIPVYASQDMYSGAPRPLEDRDLNGVIFGDSPWVLDTSGNAADPARQLFPTVTAFDMRLQAFGLDAFRLYPRLRLLESSPDAKMPGESGVLRLGPNRNIERELSWATITEGLVQILE
jgi:outer membrane PBP1 activator LpoA protein